MRTTLQVLTYLKPTAGGKTYVRDIRGRFLWGRQSEVTHRGPRDTRKSTSGMAQPETRYRSHVDNRGGIYSGLRRDVGRGMERTVPEGTPHQPRTVNPEDSQWGSLQSLTNVELPPPQPPQPPHRTPISLFPPASSIREAGYTYHPGEGEPSRHPDQAHSDELNNLETPMAGFDWGNWIDLPT